MAGFREFVTGEVLTAANVDDFLAKQVVQKYADAAARDAALGTAVAGGNALREGMVAYLDSTDEVIKYDGTAWTPIGNAGIGSNVVQTVKTDTFSASVAGGSYSADAIDVTITPTSASSKILIIATLSVSANSFSDNSSILGLLRRNGSATTYIGDANSSNQRVSSASVANTSVRAAQPLTIIFLDSPATTSPVDYSVGLGWTSVSANTTTIHLNRNSSGGGTADIARTASSMTAIEVAA